MNLEITPRQCQALIHLLDHEIVELGPEIRRTQTRSYKEGLKEHRHELAEVKSRLERLADQAGFSHRAKLTRLDESPSWTRKFHQRGCVVSRQTAASQ